MFCVELAHALLGYTLCIQNEHTKTTIGCSRAKIDVEINR